MNACARRMVPGQLLSVDPDGPMGPLQPVLEVLERTTRRELTSTLVEKNLKASTVLGTVLVGGERVWGSGGCGSVGGVSR
eukprot:COSAG03_NODE_20207_length_323_cov_0.513393_1_plen_79_part_01